ncbi:MAG: ATP synthase F1 subunit delta [Mariprofundaceae bacterium]
MSTSSISRRYARALFELEQGGSKLRADLKKVAAVALEPAVVELLADVKIPSSVQEAVICKVSAPISSEVARFIGILSGRGKCALIPEIVEMFEAMVHEFEAELFAEVTVAVPLDSKAEKRLKDALGKGLGKKVRLSVHEDSSILGGVVVQIGDRQIDHSVRGKLDGLRRAMVA